MEKLIIIRSPKVCKVIAIVKKYTMHHAVTPNNFLGAMQKNDDEEKKTIQTQISR